MISQKVSTWNLVQSYCKRKDNKEQNGIPLHSENTPERYAQNPDQNCNLYQNHVKALRKWSKIEENCKPELGNNWEMKGQNPGNNLKLKQKATAEINIWEEQWLRRQIL